MAYNSVGTPRFYINILEWYDSLGVTSFGPEYYTLPISKYNTWESTGDFSAASAGFTGQNFIALLGHKMAEGTVNCYVFDADGYEVIPAEIINQHPYSGNGYNGFSISSFVGIPYTLKFDNPTGNSDGSAEICSVVIGSYFELSHSADLSLTISYETGTKNITTVGGASLSNTLWRPPLWGDLGQWELSNPASATSGQILAHSSRRIWNLSFSFLDKTNTFPKYNALNRLIDQDETLPDDETLLTSDDFFSQVWNKVGTALPFIFQPDIDVNEFAICKFDQKNISFQQTAPGLYSVKCKIREVW